MEKVAKANDSFVEINQMGIPKKGWKGASETSLELRDRFPLLEFDMGIGPLIFHDCANDRKFGQSI